MARNSGSFCLGLLRAGITGVPRHASSLMALSWSNTLLSDPPVQCGRWWVPGSWGFSVEEAHCSVPEYLVLCVVFYTFLGKICNWFICIVFLKNLASVSLLRCGDEGGSALEFRAPVSSEVNKALRSDCCVCVWGHQTLELLCSYVEARNASHMGPTSLAGSLESH